jgi:hypothetical protein
LIRFSDYPATLGICADEVFQRGGSYSPALKFDAHFI